MFNATASGTANLVGEQELVHDVTSGRVDLAAVPPAALPEPLAGLSRDEQEKVIAETAKRRGELQQQISALAGERDAFIEGKLEELGGDKDSLDRQVYDALREQAASKGVIYESGPKF